MHGCKAFNTVSAKQQQKAGNILATIHPKQPCHTHLNPQSRGKEAHVVFCDGATEVFARRPAAKLPCNKFERKHDFQHIVIRNQVLLVQSLQAHRALHASREVVAGTATGRSVIPSTTWGSQLGFKSYYLRLLLAAETWSLLTDEGSVNLLELCENWVWYGM